MPLPKRRSNESKAEFLNRCISDDKMTKEFPNQKQKIAICLNLSNRNDYSEKEYSVGKRGSLKKKK